MAAKRNTRYNRLAADEDDEYYGSGSRHADRRFEYSPKSLDRVPWKSLALAFFLLSLGCLLLLLSLFILTSHMAGDQSQAHGLLGLGILTFLPGFELIVVDVLFLSSVLHYWDVPEYLSTYWICGKLALFDISSYLCFNRLARFL
ncbi:unnamed protein product [Cuscuta epithymum]|uniref:Transmembrane protein 230 n=1 Tax=Cuscuta epithymum TaxID=186058 RepID=A0AAV0G654_9ASTE|nr:unnamed protein product [Cuscuta epithymum]